MLHFLQDNWVTLITLTVLAVIVTLAIWRIVKDKKNGIGACGHKCSECSNASCCQSLSSKNIEAKGNDVDVSH